MSKKQPFICPFCEDQGVVTVENEHDRKRTARCEYCRGESPLRARVATLEGDCRRLQDLLRLPQVQWGNRGWTDDRPLVGHCPICDQPESKDHAPDCPIGAELEEAQP